MTILRLSDAKLPDALEAAIAEAGVTAGWISATAIVQDVEIRVFDPIAGRAGVRRKISGRIEAVSLTGQIVSSDDGVMCVLRVVLSRETETGIETFAGELSSARATSFDGFIHAATGSAIDVPSPGKPQPAAAPKSAWQVAAESVEGREAEAPQIPRPRESSPAVVEHAMIPPRPPPKAQTPFEENYPEANDLVDHFAFGRCEVMKSDGDRLILRLGKDGRLKEIALEMLKVTPQPGEGGKRLYKLDRRI